MYVDKQEYDSKVGKVMNIDVVEVQEFEFPVESHDSL